MDVRALIIAGGNAEHAPGTPAAEYASEPETLAGVPLAVLDVLGRPVLHHVVAQLREAGIHVVSVVAEERDGVMPELRRARLPDVSWTESSGAGCWRAAVRAFNALAQNGAELVLVFRLGPFTEINFEELIQFHLDQRARVTCVSTPGGQPAGVFAISASRRNDAAFLFRHQLRECRVPAAEYIYDGYFNPLRSAADLRQLAIDGLYGDIRLQPAGRQHKPGVWVADGARIHPRARVLAPAFIGARARIRAKAVLTRGVAVEHHSEVDCGTVVENSSLLPFSYIGPGLDLCHSVIGFRRLAHLRRGVEVEIGDSKLIASVTASAPLRALSGAAGLAAYLPMQLFRGMFAKSHRDGAAELPQPVSPGLEELEEHELSEESPAGAHKFPADLMIARRYGNE